MGMRVYQSVCCGVYSCCAAKHAWPGRYSSLLLLGDTANNAAVVIPSPPSASLDETGSDNTKYAQHADSMGEAA